MASCLRRLCNKYSATYIGHMKNLERILWIIAAIAILLRLFSMPFAGVLLVLSFSALSIVYFLLSWKLFPEPGPKDHLVPVSLVGGLVLANAVIDLLFRIQLWPQSELRLIVGLVGLAGLAVVLFVLRTKRPDLGAYTRGLLFRTLPLLAVSLLFFVALPTAKLAAFYYRNDPQLLPLVIERHTTTDREEQMQLQQRIDSIQYARITAEVEARPR